jgi:hypothetical protein
MSSNDQDVTGESGSGVPSQEPPQQFQQTTRPVEAPPDTGTRAAPQTWGAEQPAAGPRWSAKKTIAAVAVAVGIAAAGGGVIYAAAGSTADAAGGPGGGFPGGRAAGGGAAFGDALHGEFQTGEVTEVGDTSISVESTDGYTRTYVIDDETIVGGATGTDGRQQGQVTTGDISGIETGDTVVVVATTEDGTTTADSVSERGDVRTAPGGQDGRQQGVQPRRQDDESTDDGTGDEQPPTTS